jgi:hypothetical protein
MPNPKPPVPEVAKAMAGEDALDAARLLRGRWGDSERPTMPLLQDDPPKSQFQRRAETAADWSPSLVADYLDAFCARLAAENIIYVIGILGGPPYVVDYCRWEHPAEHRLGRINYSGDPHAGWILRD